MRFPTRHPLQPHRPVAPPPGGFAGAAQQTSATIASIGAPVVHTGYAMMSNGRRSSTTRRRRRKATRTTVRKARKASRKRSTTKRKRSGGRRARLVKGSAAAKRFMARLRAKRRK